MKSIMIIVMMLIVVTASAFAQGELTITKIAKIEGNGQQNTEGNAEYSITYWISCSQKFIGFTTIGVPPYATSIDNMAVVAVVKESGFACAGPTVQETASLSIKGPLSVGGVQLTSIQPNP